VCNLQRDTATALAVLGRACGEHPRRMTWTKPSRPRSASAQGAIPIAVIAALYRSAATGATVHT
jgi:hypothetical protein